MKFSKTEITAKNGKKNLMNSVMKKSNNKGTSDIIIKFKLYKT